jgi:hypothetical protein
MAGETFSAVFRAHGLLIWAWAPELDAPSDRLVHALCDKIDALTADRDAWKLRAETVESARDALADECDAWKARAESVCLLTSTAEALDELVCHVGRVNVDLPSMAWLLFVCRELEDTETRFPHGKWATIQHIEARLTAAAKVQAREIGEALR